MAVTFPDEIHPKYKFKIRFTYWARPMQYLEYFNIVISHPEYNFLPLNLNFKSQQELIDFLYNRGIFQDEIEVNDSNSNVSDKITIVDTRKIYNVEESVSKYLLNYKYYSINEVAEMLSFSRPTVYKLVNDQSIKAIRINGQLRVNHLDLMNFICEENQ